MTPIASLVTGPVGDPVCFVLFVNRLFIANPTPLVMRSGSFVALPDVYAGRLAAVSSGLGQPPRQKPHAALLPQAVRRNVRAGGHAWYGRSFFVVFMHEFGVADVNTFNARYGGDVPKTTKVFFSDFSDTHPHTHTSQLGCKRFSFGCCSFCFRFACASFFASLMIAWFADR